MYGVLEVLTILLVALAMALSLAHALELPGKRRLGRDAYLAVQPIYFPGFTIGGGVGEAGGLVATLLLVILTPRGGIAFWLILAAFLALLCMHLLYWVLTHPVNNFWLKNFKLQGAGRGFFAFDPLGRNGDAGHADWTLLRDRWEYSHVARAVLGLLSLALLSAAVAAQR